LDLIEYLRHVRLLHPSVGASCNLMAVAAALDIPIPDELPGLKRQRGRLHTLPLTLTLDLYPA
jgi:hypothetical protein